MKKEGKIKSLNKDALRGKRDRETPKLRGKDFEAPHVIASMINSNSNSPALFRSLADNSGSSSLGRTSSDSPNLLASGTNQQFSTPTKSSSSGNAPRSSSTFRATLKNQMRKKDEKKKTSGGNQRNNSTKTQKLFVSEN